MPPASVLMVLVFNYLPAFKHGIQLLHPIYHCFQLPAVRVQVYFLYSNWSTNFRLEWAAGMSIGLFMGVQNCVAFSVS